MSRAIREEQSERWLAGDKVALEVLVDSHPELASDPASLAELICGEIALRYADGQQPQLAEYLARFPQCAALLGPRPAGESPANSGEPPEYGTQMIDPGDLPSIVIDPHGVPIVAPQTGSADSNGNGSGSAQSAAPAAVDPARLSALLKAIPEGGGTMQVAMPAALADSAPQQTYETVQSIGDPKDVTAIINRIQAPTLKIPGYDIQKELGRGGMGVVYKARQLSADRIVALKVIRNDVLDTLPHETRSNTIERFRQEAQAAAKIEHDHLVSVYEVGEHEGLKYYAMRFVEGKSLADTLRDGPLENRRAAGYMEPVCRAIHAIHEHGVLHRDIKPHNIMIDRRGDRPLVTDFGLAKFVGGQDELTHAGSVMGTPSYMSPEQAKDSGKVGPLADVYSLGATLYHCVTGRAPFQAAHVADTLRQILNDDPIPPRRLNPAIDRDLETICLKSLLKDPAQRYDSAQSLADDLARYLRNEPILARPISTTGRAWRWCLRNRLAASLMATAATAIVLALVAASVGWYTTTFALDKSNRSLRKGLALVEEFCTVVAEDTLLNRPGLQPLRRDLLERAQRYYESFMVEHENDPYLRNELGQAHFRLGVIQRELGNPDGAIESLQKAFEIQKDQYSLGSKDVGTRRAYGNTLNALGTLLQDLDRLDEAEITLRDAADVRERLVNDYPESVELQRIMANTVMNRGILDLNRGTKQKSVGPLDAAGKFMMEAQARRNQLLPRAGDARRSIERDLAKGYFALCKLGLMKDKILRETKQEVPAELGPSIDANFEKANELFRKLIDERPELMDRYLFVFCLRMQGDSQTEEKALQCNQEAREQLEVLVRENPDVPSYQVELAEVHLNLANLYVSAQQSSLRRAELDQARRILVELQSKMPDDEQIQAQIDEIDESLKQLGPSP